MGIDNLGACHLAVGQTIEAFKGALMDACSCDIYENITTYAIMNGINEEIIEAFTEGKVTFGVAEFNDFMMLTIEIENLIEAVMPFQVNLYPVQCRFVAGEFSKGTGYDTFLALIDGMSGEVVRLRAVGLGTKISNTIRGIIRNQISLENYDSRAFQIKLQEYYSRHTVEDTKKKCIVKYVCGTTEDAGSE